MQAAGVRKESVQRDGMEILLKLTKTLTKKSPLLNDLVYLMSSLV